MILDFTTNLLGETNMDKMVTEEDIYADQQLTLREAIAVVIGKRAAGIPLMGAREELADDFLTDWAELFGMDSL